MAPLGHTETVSLSSIFSLSGYLGSSDLLTKCSFWRFPPPASTSKASRFFAANQNQTIRFMCAMELWNNSPGIDAGSLIGTWRALSKKLYTPHSIQPKNDLWAPIKWSPSLVGSCHLVVWSVIKISILVLKNFHEKKASIRNKL